MNDFVEGKILPLANKIQSNFWLKTISGSFAMLMPVLMASALFSLIQGLPLGDWYTNLLSNSGMTALFADIVAICSLTAIFLELSLGYILGKSWDIDPFTTAAVALLSLLVVTPLTTTVTDSMGVALLVTNVLSTSSLGAQGLFTAILIGILSVSIYRYVHVKGWKIKMPDSVPEMVAKPFEGIVPGVFVVLIFTLIRFMFLQTSYGYLNNFIYQMVQMPLVSLGNSFPAMIIAALVVTLLWWFGIHGTLVVLTIMMPFWYGPAIDNLNNYMAGLPVTNIVGYMFFFLFMQFIGGPGSMFGLYVNMAFFSKSARYKTLGKLAFVPGMFNIIEPTVFGFPIVLNPVMFIPFVFTPVLFMIIGYFLMTSGIVGVPALLLAVMTMPGPIVGFLLGGGISLGIFLLALCLISIVIYYPFFKVCDMQALNEEKIHELELT